MSEQNPDAVAGPASDHPQTPAGWRDLLRKEDWWSVWLGLAVVIIAYV
jgi:hypothetical protein